MTLCFDWVIIPQIYVGWETDNCSEWTVSVISSQDGDEHDDDEEDEQAIGGHPGWLPCHIGQ